MFIAHTVGISEDEYCWTVSVCDQPDTVEHYFVVQRSKASDEQDRILGMERLYFEFDDQSRGFYGGVRKITLSRRQLDISLDEDVARARSLPSIIEIGLLLEDADWQRLRTGLNAVASEEQPGWLEC